MWRSNSKTVLLPSIPTKTDRQTDGQTDGHTDRQASLHRTSTLWVKRRFLVPQYPSNRIINLENPKENRKMINP